MVLLNTDIKTLMDKVKTEKLRILCVGQGMQLTEACDCYEEYSFFEHIHSIYDNSPRLFVWKEQEKQALAVEKIANSLDGAVVYISSGFYPELYEQLNNIPQLAETDCYIHSYVSHIPIPYEFPKGDNVQRIPKKIHYFWFGGNLMPEHNLEWMKSWGKYCPDYEIVRWDETNFDITKNEYIHSAYKEKKFSFVADYARLDILYKHGGICLDVDVELVTGLDKLLTNRAFCGTMNHNDGPNFGLAVAAEPEFPLMAELRDYYNNVSFYNEDGTLNQAYCSCHQSTVLARYGYKCRNALDNIEGMMIYPSDVFCPKNWVGLLPLAFTHNTVSIHHFDSTWYEEDKFHRVKRLVDKYQRFYNKYPISKSEKSGDLEIR